VFRQLDLSEINSIGSLLDIMFIREGYSVLSVHFELSALQITDIITSIVTNYLFTRLFLSICCTVPSIFCIICSFCVLRVRIKIIIIIIIM